MHALLMLLHHNVMWILPFLKLLILPIKNLFAFSTNLKFIPLTFKDKQKKHIVFSCKTKSNVLILLHRKIGTERYVLHIIKNDKQYLKNILINTAKQIPQISN